ncbi:MAG: hypothetical protein JWL86_43 [Rhizobium sp.]|nr:hypothetical protein [Rhizobium sp.]
MSWKPATFEIATVNGVFPVAGYIYRGLGLHMQLKGSPKGRRRAVWHITHLNSGHAVGVVTGTVSEAFPLATGVAEAGDWDFESLWGWKDRFPEASTRIRDILGADRGMAHKTCRAGSLPDLAREIAMARPA